MYRLDSLRQIIYKTCDNCMPVCWLRIVILDGELICIIIYMCDYIEKHDNTSIYPQHPIPKPI